MTDTEIKTYIYTKLATDSTLPDIAFPNVEFDSTSKTEWLEVAIMPLPTLTLGFGATKDLGGLVQVTCVVRKDVGELAASRIADKVLALFPIKSHIATGLKVEKEPYVSAGFTSDTLYKIPVTLQYRVLKN